MIATCIAALVLAPQETAAQPTPAQLVSTMLARYAGAKSLVGTIQFVQSAANVSVTIETRLQLERPGKLYIFQSRQSSEPRTWTVTADGRQFSYDAPGGSGRRLVEPMGAGTVSPTLVNAYAAASGSLGDRSAPLDIAVGRLEDLKYLRGQWATLGPVKGEGVPQGVIAVGGDWREYQSAAVSGTYEMWVTPEGDLKRYVIRETIAPDPRLGPTQVTSTWNVNLKVDGTPDANLFRVLR